MRDALASGNVPDMSHDHGADQPMVSRPARRLAIAAVILLVACSQRDRQVKRESLAVVVPKSRAAFPTVFHDACQGEDCETRFLGLTCAPATLRAQPNESSPVIEQLPKGDTVDVIQTDLHVLAPGLVTMQRDFALNWYDDPDGGRFPRKDTLSFATSDTLYLLRYLALGEWLWWRNNRLESGSQFWAASDGFGATLSDSSIAVALSQPEIQTWLRVIRPNGPRGWWQVDSMRSIRSIESMKRWNDFCS
jgi:hypothetical protein